MVVAVQPPRIPEVAVANRECPQQHQPEATIEVEVGLIYSHVYIS